MLEDLKLFKMLLDSDEYTAKASVDCVACGVDVYDVADHDMSLRFDDMGASYCNLCWAKR